MDGILVIDKPKGLTSHDCVKIIRKKFGIKKVGHAGTLDPLATGILIMLLGKATRLFPLFASFDKEYEATLTLGFTTDTGDVEGKILKPYEYKHVSAEKLKQALNKFQGEIEQIPPMFSALKHQGIKLYQLARKGIEVKRPPRKITIYSLILTRYAPPEADFKVKCSKGTYVRKLAEDIAREVDSGGCISSIRRINVGPFKIEEAKRIEEINESYLRQWPV